MKANILRLFLIALIAGLIGYYVGVNKIKIDWQNYHPKFEVISKEPPPEVSKLDLTQFWAVLERLELSYYDKKAIDSQKLLNGAISGMVDSLDDPYTMYLPPKQNGDFKQGLAGKFEGIGAELGTKAKQIIVIQPLGGSPAQAAGVRIGDSILKVNGELTLGWTLSKAIEKIRGPKGTSVLLTVVHKDDEKPTDIKIVRDTIQVKSIDSWVKKIKDIDAIDSKKFKSNADQKVAHIRLSQFGDSTNQEWISVINKLAMDLQNDKNTKGVILDLRNNPGGYLSDAVYIASEFIPSGTVVIQEDGNTRQVPMPVSRKGLLYNTPIIVLINKGSASASEIVAGALRDHKRAKLVGKTSFGKGTIQQAEDLGGGAGLHVTVAKWLTPDGIWVHQKGLTPDFIVEVDTKNQAHDAQPEKAVEELLQ